MAYPNPYPDSGREIGDDTGVGPLTEPPAGTPLWVKIFGVTALVLVLLFVILHLAGRAPGGH